MDSQFCVIFSEPTQNQTKSHNELVNKAQITKPMTAFSFFCSDLGLKIEFFI